jgi:aminopeptidase N
MGMVRITVNNSSVPPGPVAVRTGAGSGRMGRVSSLTMQEAVARAASVTVDAYALDVDLTGGPETFRSTTTIAFTVVADRTDTFVQVRPVALDRARLDGADLDPTSLADGRLPLTDLAAGRHELTVEAEFPYSHASEGMHHFVDPADGERYVYAQPSIAQAPAFMACFDQPDLKAPVTLRVNVDPGWRVRANSDGQQTSPGRWEFAATPPLATYLITLAAGPFHEVTSVHDGIPLGLLARVSLAEHLDREAPELFEITGACLDHYHELFGIRYPYGKYDQVFAPEFSWGAMEFPGCVLVRDELVFRSAVTDTQRQSRAVLVAHEMAHMWFGNLVTMRWWDDLWLNESFADYLGWRVVAEATRWRSAWTAYSVARKTWGYAADQRPSTHPVAPGEVADTAAALANFDGISYAKGSAVLRQLVARVGDEAFRSGLRAYFETHAHGNATLADLLAALSKASGQDLTDWALVWLREPGVNLLRPQVQVGADGTYSSVQVVQSAPQADPVLRPHRIRVGVYGSDGHGGIGQDSIGQDSAGGPVVRRAVAPTDLQGAVAEVPGLVGVAAGALLVVNDDDLTYAKIRTDGDLVSLLPRVADPLARAVLWTAAWDACRDAELAPDRFVALAAAALPHETEVPVFETMLQGSVETVVERYLPPVARSAAYAALAGACRQVLAQAPPGGDAQLAAARGLVACAGRDDLRWLAGLLVGEGVPDGLAVDQELRWTVLLALVTHGGAGEEEIDAERQRDPSARGVQEATRCRAAQPDASAKEQAWRVIVADRDLSNRVVVAAAGGFWRASQLELTDDYVERFFGEAGDLARSRPQQLITALAREAYPSYAVEERTLVLAERCLADDDLPPVLRRVVVDCTDDLRRALAARRAYRRGVA